MEFRKYQCLCSNKILKLLKEFLNDDKISDISDAYSSLFVEKNSIPFTWVLISNSLLMSESLYKYQKTYKLISDGTIDLLEEKLLMTSRCYPGDSITTPCLLDSKNNIANSFNDFVGLKSKYDTDSILNYSVLDKPDTLTTPEDDKYFVDLLKGAEDKFNSIRVDGSYGCNESIMEDGMIDIRRLIIRTRNALAHSNYEVIDDNLIRLYHYNRKTKKLDFNVALDSSMGTLIIDELNEIASRKYSNFMDIYFNKDVSEELLERELVDKDYIDYMLSFDIFGEEIAREILEVVKSRNDFFTFSNEDKIVTINNLIYDKIRPSFDAGIIINDYLYCDESGRISSDELYDKYGLYKYLNSPLYDSNDKDINDNEYIQNKFKFLLLSLFNCSILNGFNINENNEQLFIDFSKIIVDEDILKKFLIKNGVKSKLLMEQLEEMIERKEKEILLSDETLEKNKKILETRSIENDYYLVELPRRIEELKEKKNNDTYECAVLRSELFRVGELGCMYRYEENLSRYIFSSLRDSLAHGYVKFPKKIDLNNVTDTVITFEDYNPKDKAELTFKGSIKLGDLLGIITSPEYVELVFGNSGMSNVPKTNTKK